MKLLHDCHQSNDSNLLPPQVRSLKTHRGPPAGVMRHWVPIFA